MQCDEAQGYYICKPNSWNVIENWLRENKHIWARYLLQKAAFEWNNRHCRDTSRTCSKLILFTCIRNL